jgi:hypothetical protein
MMGKLIFPICIVIQRGTSVYTKMDFLYVFKLF